MDQIDIDKVERIVMDRERSRMRTHQIYLKESNQ